VEFEARRLSRPCASDPVGNASPLLSQGRPQLRRYVFGAMKPFKRYFRVDIDYNPR
jgi:hypothetical protein